MSYSNCSTLAAPVLLPAHTELVRGEEERFVAQLLPQVKRESVALDLSRVDRIDAAGIAALITLYCSAVEAGKQFTVVSPSAHVLELLHIVGLDSILIDRKASPCSMRLSAA